MFTEVREMIDSTVYTNGRSEVTAQNVNLAMHGIIDATEDKLEEVGNNFNNLSTSINADIEDIKTQLEEGTGNAVALSIQFPLLILENFAVEGVIPGLTVNNMVLAPEIIDLIAPEIPMLVEPLNNVIEENRKIISQCLQLLQEGKDLPIININVAAGYKELIELESPGMSSLANISMIMSPMNTVFYNTPEINMLMLMFADGEGTVEIAITPEGYVQLTMQVPGYFTIPAPTKAAYDNSEYVQYILSDSSENTHHVYKYQYGDEYSDTYFITPLIVTMDATNMYVRFLVGLDILEGIINLTDGMTTSRIVGSITPVN